MSTHRRSPSAWRALWAAHNTPAEGSWLRQKATSLAILGLYLLAESAMASAPPDIYFQCIYLDNALTFLGNPALAPANPAENPAWCCGLDQSDGDSQRTVVCTGNATDGSLAISELRWTNAGLKGSLTSLRPSWLSHLKLLNFSGNTGLVGSFPSWLQDTDQWKTLVSL